MSAFSQAGRPMRVETALGEDVLLLAGLTGDEGVSMPFRWRLELLSEDGCISPGDVLRTPVTLHLRLADGSERIVHGLVRRFAQLGRRDELAEYRAEVVPWLWFLSLGRECRIYQNLSVPEIAEQVFRAQGWSDFELRCTKSYPKREYCVQYRETHLDFVQRLLEDEGIFYFFEHSAGKHLLVLADGADAVQPCPAMPKARMAPQEAPDGDDVVTELYREHAARAGKVALRDYDPLQPSLKLESTLSGEEPEEVYDYPGGYTQPGEGDRYARLRLEAQAARRETVRGAGTCRAFASGFRFDLADHYRSDANQAYTLLRVRHTARAGDYRSWESAPLDYRNRFLATPHSVPWRPPRATARPIVRGSQTALVVGPAGEEVWTDKHGRIKVQFYWDREGKKDENSSCWVRVAQPWAGKGWGAVQIPRIGNEVVVEFLEGDPDRPLVTGSVYNAEQAPPFALPGIQMGMKSRSSPGGGGYNEITMTDTKGKEAITIHGQYDMTTTVEHDRTDTVKNNETVSITVDRTESVGGNEQISITGNRTESVGGNEQIAVTGTRTETVGADETLTVTGSRTRTVVVNESVNVGVAQEVTVIGARTLSVGLGQSTSITGGHTVSVGRDQGNTIDGGRTTKVGKDDSLTVAKKLVIDAGDEISIKTGSASIVMKKDGTITIKGKDVTVEGSGGIDVKATKDVVLKGSKVLQN